MWSKPVGKIVSVSGPENEIDIIQPLKEHTRRGQAGTPLSPGDIISTANGVSARILINNHTHIQVQANTKLKINDIYQTSDKQTSSSVGLLLGKIAVKVKKALQKKNRVSVHTSTCTAGVRGTSFQVYSPYAKKVWVGVDSGTVEIQKDQQVKTILNKKQQLFFEEYKAPVPKSFLSTSKADRWFEEKRQSFVRGNPFFLRNLIKIIAFGKPDAQSGGLIKKYKAFNKRAGKPRLSLLDKRILQQQVGHITRRQNRFSSYYYSLKDLVGKNKSPHVKAGLDLGRRFLRKSRKHQITFYKNANRLFGGK